MAILEYIVGRILQMVPVLFGVSLVAFLCIHLVPGDPVQIMMHGRATPEVLATVRAELGLDQPLPEQYLRFIGGAIVGDLGKSIIQKAPVNEIIGERLGPSLFLLVYSAVLAVLFALPLAVVAALRAERLIDHSIRILGVVGFAMPPFWIGLLLMVLFGLVLNWFPISGYGDSFVEHLWHLFLPSVTIAVFLAPLLVQSLRSAMLDVMTADYIEVARAKGLSRRRIVVKHVLRNAAIPVVTVLAVNIGWLLGGAVIVEYVFAFPGLGSLLVRAVGFRDYPVIQGLTLVFAVIVMIINLLADLSYMAIDRRVLRR
ncbi:MAG: ABC transporter permease [Alphaproteobacteria bacterium]|nr:ABC transporter permease [Alphaproteobacteria bacterium]